MLNILGIETFVQLIDEEIKLLKLKVSLMSDFDILNRESGNGVAMGIPIVLSKERLKDIRDKLVGILRRGPFIDFEAHAVERIVYDSLLPDGHPEKRGWISQQEAKDCVMTANWVHGIRLNVNHEHPDNNDKIKHLHPHLAIAISGQKASGEGRLVLVILNERTISVVTVL
ncbi:hypothetical protein ACF3MZ_23670 [Paenibacillaceae bacterium WGS1546]|uniref:hypothetical protein n=1 Tax=Cohnella sp. WGS1546 TaxID=3366810 RepID=UPI00372D793E